MNITDTIVAKSDQLNADDLIGRDITIVVSKVTIPGGEQPVSIHYEGDNGKPYKPGKSMRRVLVHVWGPDANTYVGRAMTLYRDDEVLFGGLKVGGIRISHMSHMGNATQTMALTATRGNKKAFRVQPLIIQAPPTKTDKTAEAADTLIVRIAACETEDALHAVAGDTKISEWRAKLRDKRPELEASIAAAFGDRYAALIAPAGDDVPFGDAPGDEAAA